MRGTGLNWVHKRSCIDEQVWSACPGKSSGPAANHGFIFLSRMSQLVDVWPRRTARPAPQPRAQHLLFDNFSIF